MSLFTEKAPGIIDRLRKDFGLTPEQAAGIVGNLGHESAGFAIMQEVHPVSGRGGYGWAQWTGSRRVAYESFCAKNGFEPAGDQGNYSFLRVELSTVPYEHAVTQVKKTTTVDAAVETFEANYERAGVPALDSRKKYAVEALVAWQAAQAAQPVPAPIPAPAPIHPPIDVTQPPPVPAGPSQLDRIEARLGELEALLNDIIAILHTKPS